MFFVFVYWAGELDRKDRDKDKPLRILPQKMLQHRDLLKKPLFIVGLGFLAVWIGLYWSKIRTNLGMIFTNSLPIFLGIVAVLPIGIIIIKWETREGKTAIV